MCKCNFHKSVYIVLLSPTTKSAKFPNEFPCSKVFIEIWRRISVLLNSIQKALAIISVINSFYLNHSRIYKLAWHLKWISSKISYIQECSFYLYFKSAILIAVLVALFLAMVNYSAIHPIKYLCWEKNKVLSNSTVEEEISTPAMNS